MMFAISFVLGSEWASQNDSAIRELPAMVEIILPSSCRPIAPGMYPLTVQRITFTMMYEIENHYQYPELCREGFPG